MLKVLPHRPRQIGGKRIFALVASQYNPRYVQGLVDHAAREIMAIMPGANLRLYQTPGAWEIPIVAQELAMQKVLKVDAILALGVIIQGETGHGDHIAHSVTVALQRIALRSRIPVIHEVLSVKNEDQARVRCLEKEHNRGTEAARAALDIVELLTELKEG